MSLRTHRLRMEASEGSLREESCLILILLEGLMETLVDLFRRDITREYLLLK